MAPALASVDDGVVRLGKVAAWDDARGVGALAAEDGTMLDFHCTVIVDGSRTIEQGVRVAYTVVSGRLGLPEAGVVTPVA
jgi:cold shock CspA family protein